MKYSLSIPSHPILTLADPNKRDITCRVGKTSRSYQVMFTPLMVGPHRVELNFGNMMIDGSPYTCQVIRLFLFNYVLKKSFIIFLHFYVFKDTYSKQNVFFRK